MVITLIPLALAPDRGQNTDSTSDFEVTEPLISSRYETRIVQGTKSISCTPVNLTSEEYLALVLHVLSDGSDHPRDVSLHIITKPESVKRIVDYVRYTVDPTFRGIEKAAEKLCEKCYTRGQRQLAIISYDPVDGTFDV
ncbi:hypothetical protein KCU89_g15, partial [Aureobasidium melanogenum]